MSYVVTSSQQSQYGGAIGPGGAPTRVQIALENPAKYQNYFNSPLKIEPDSEIALDSIKITRAGLFDIEDVAVFYRYWGLEQTSAVVDAPGGAGYRNSMPIAVRPRPGVYSIRDMTTELDDRLNESYVSPDIFGQTAVTRLTNASGAFQGFSFLTTQRGNASLAAKDASGSAVMRNTSTYWKNPRNISRATASVAVTADGTGTRLTRVPVVGVPGELDDGYGQWIGGGMPLGLVQGHFTCEVENASLGGWRAGLSRPQLQFRATPQVAGGRPSSIVPGGEENTPMGAGLYPIINPTTLREQSDFYDYMVEDEAVTRMISVYHTVWDSQNDKFVQEELTYWDAARPAPFNVQMTSAVFNASFDRVMFTTSGDEVSLTFIVRATNVEHLVVDSSISVEKHRVFVPIGETRNCLYPKITIATPAEYVTVRRWDSHYTDLTEHVYPSYNAPDPTLPGTVTTGDSFYVNNRIGRKRPGDSRPFAQDQRNRPYCLSQTLIADQKWAYDVNDAGNQAFVGELGANAGIAYDHVWTIGNVRPTSVDDYLQGRYYSQNADQSSVNQADLSRQLGFADKVILKETDTTGYVTIAGGGAAVSFNSFEEPSFRTHSAFVRVSNLGHNSYNGAKQSISKMLYHIPRFTNDGRQFGDLYFRPGEKTYVKLNNTDLQLLNNIEVQITDVDERPVRDLTANTIVCFHIRRRR